VGIPCDYTNVFWGGKSEIKPSEISPIVYRNWHAKWQDVARRGKTWQDVAGPVV